MSKKFRKIFGLSKRTDHPTSHSGGQSTPDRRSSDHPTPDPRTSGQPTPNQQRITDPYDGQNILGATSSGHPGPYSSSQPTVDPHFSDQPIADPRYSRQPNPNQQSITYPYPGQHIVEATSAGHPGPYSSSQPPVHPRFGDQSITGSRFSVQPNSYQQGFINPYEAQHFPVPQPSPYSSFRDQLTPNQQRITDPYGGQPILEAPYGGYRRPYYSSQPAVDPRFGNQPITDPRYNTPNQQSTTAHIQLVKVSSNPLPVVIPSHVQVPSPSTTASTLSPMSTTTGVFTLRMLMITPHSWVIISQEIVMRGQGQWHVRYHENEQYSIENVDHNRYANCGPRAGLKAFVEGNSKDQLWRIQETPTGEYTIAATDTRYLWMLPYDDPDTPICLSVAYADPRCWWTFNNAETTAPVDEDPTIQTVLSDPKLLIAPSGSQPISDAAIVEFSFLITESIDLIQPLRAACRALRAVLQRAESIGHVNEDRKALIKRLKLHLAIVENDIAKLEEDQHIDKNIPAFNRDVRKALETYARELKETCELLSDNQPSNLSLVNKLTSIGHNKGIVADKTLKIDEAFQVYTAALHQFAANTVAQMQQQLTQFGQEFQQGAEKVHTPAEKRRPNRPNAYGIQHRECLQGTREKTLSAISNWVDDENTKKWIFFFLDVAGSGKSTVAKHMAEKWKREEQLLARFFFSRDTTATMSTDSFCSTVANAFALLDPKFKEHTEGFSKRPDLGLLSFEERFEGLVAGPLRAIGRRAILIIDALDECDAKQRDELLGTLRDQHSSIPLLRILATGRPERDIKRWAEKKFGFDYMNFSRLEENDKDVELYIKHTLQDVPHIQDRLYPVISRAEGLFIWARIACDLLLDSDDIDGLLEELGKEVSLDYLYKVALRQSTPKEGASRRAMVLVLQMILAAREPLSIAELEMLSTKPGIVERIVNRLGSVLLYQGREDPIRLLHATFREFLTTRSKADIFFIEPELGHHTLASGCLATISYLSKQDDSTLQDLDAISERKEILFEQDTY